jgi:hypothetical protein
MNLWDPYVDDRPKGPTKLPKRNARVDWKSGTHDRSWGKPSRLHRCLWSAPRRG